ncbi:unknown similar to AMEV043 [Choristoneura rosaceana entomopoxvirus 'L']|uniref:Uncharacterized protein n=2 Tax=Betaentomopoxvirus TaxID=10286 RepID=A0A916NXM0_CBEPV|nr:unknown similar to AMEV043 [Choristoneura biennis entomopoxvirus]YP_008004463.1 unknown similar to AMEV043 [Choristoneura rosaceana entomopoxvirus 'L']CCU55648.1 unknown similar to AMEV043 [Choristoneura biennis entomopoxvirus]CCU55961.1 unknown similar to AMEV043 [Choristoneura rosaceana entomopoxvirus 'L']
MVYLIECKGVFLTHYYYLYDTGKINDKQLADIAEKAQSTMITLKVITTIRNLTIQNKIKPMDMISPV